MALGAAGTNISSGSEKASGSERPLSLIHLVPKMSGQATGDLGWQ